MVREGLEKQQEETYLSGLTENKATQGGVLLPHCRKNRREFFQTRPKKKGIDSEKKKG